MLVAQTLCTNGSEQFRRVAIEGSKKSSESDRDYTIRILSKLRETMDKELKNV